MNTMFRLATRQKMAIARMLNRTVHVARAAFGKEMQGEFERNGLRWELDLNEGIDLAIYLLGAFERDLVRCYERMIKPGDTVLDIGANIGAHTLPLARAVGENGRVVAVEATEYAFGKLQRNIRLNPSIAPRVTSIHALLTAGADDAHVESQISSSWRVDRKPESDDPLCGTAKAVGAAQAVSLDRLLSQVNTPPPAWIKIDVDGHERSVLQGAVNCLHSARPSVFMELAPYCYDSRPNEFDALLGIFRDANYTFHRLPNLAELPQSTSSIIKAIPKNGSINVLCRPR